MTDPNSISQIATTAGAMALVSMSPAGKALIERASMAIGAIARPWLMKRDAIAEAEVTKLRANVDIAIAELRERAAARSSFEAVREQQNIEAVLLKALPHLNADALPDRIDADWLTYVFRKARDVSNEHMQELWSRIVAGEANTSGSFARRTIDIVASLEKHDAELFTTLCSRTWVLSSGYKMPISPQILIDGSDLHQLRGQQIKHLTAVGLLFDYESLMPFSVKVADGMTMRYFDQDFTLHALGTESKPQVVYGSMCFTQSGKELHSIVEATQLGPVYVNTVIQEWGKKGWVMEAL